MLRCSCCVADMVLLLLPYVLIALTSHTAPVGQVASFAVGVISNMI